MPRRTSALATTRSNLLADPASEGLARVGEDGDLIVSPLPAKQVPVEAETLAQAVAARLPRIELPALLIEVDRAVTDQAVAHLTSA